MLKLDQISVCFPDFCLDKVSLSIDKGEYHVFLGPSGAGKTLILNCIAGFQKPDTGKIIFRNRDITNIAPHKRNISFLFQDLALFPHLNVMKNVEYPLKIRGINKKERNISVDKYLEFTEISHLKNRSIDNLSGGEKQRLAIARNLITGSDIFLMDEPFSAIDSQLRISLKKLLKKISNSGITIIHVTHNFEEAINMAEKISVIENGKILESGSTESILNAPKNKFTAIFTGNKNYFACSKMICNSSRNYAVIKKLRYGEPAADKLYTLNNLTIPDSSELDELKKDNILIEIPESDNLKIEGIIIDSSNIIISGNRVSSSARNNFEAIITGIYPTKNGYEIEVYIGINLWISISKQSFLELDLKTGKMIYLFFKSSSIQLV